MQDLILRWHHYKNVLKVHAINCEVMVMSW